MKCFVSVLSLLGVAAAAPQFIADTAEVQQAKIAFAQAYNKAAQGSLVALEQAGVVADPSNPDFSPAAEPYVHVEIPAEQYIHEEIPALPYVHVEGDVEPVAPVAPVQVPVAPVQQAAIAYNQIPVVTAKAPIQQAALPFNLAPFQQYAGIYAPQQLAFAPAPQRLGGCYNWKGEGVECRL